jgi:hypothetical protein
VAVEIHIEAATVRHGHGLLGRIDEVVILVPGLPGVRVTLRRLHDLAIRIQLGSVQVTYDDVRVLARPLVDRIADGPSQLLSPPVLAGRAPGPIRDLRRLQIPSVGSGENDRQVAGDILNIFVATEVRLPRIVLWDRSDLDLQPRVSPHRPNRGGDRRDARSLGGGEAGGGIDPGDGRVAAAPRDLRARDRLPALVLDPGLEPLRRPNVIDDNRLRRDNDTRRDPWR